MGYELRAARRAVDGSEPIPGGALCFARKALGLRREQLASTLGLEPSQIEQAEVAVAVPADIRRAISALLAAPD